MSAKITNIKLKVVGEAGVHARPSAQIVKCCTKNGINGTIGKLNQNKDDITNFMAVMSLAAIQGSIIELELVKGDYKAFTEELLKMKEADDKTSFIFELVED